MHEDVNTERPEWKRLLAGGFAFMTAPFAAHASDQKRAHKSVKLAKEAAISANEYLSAASDYLDNAIGWPTNKSEQLDSVRKFIKGKLN